MRWRCSSSRRLVLAAWVLALLIASMQVASAFVAPSPASCLGIATDCPQLSNASVALCPAQAGCSVEYTFKGDGDNCTGTALPCASTVRAAVCQARPGCYWNNPFQDAAEPPSQLLAPAPAPSLQPQAGAGGTAGLCIIMCGKRNTNLEVAIIIMVLVIASLFVCLALGLILYNRRRQRRAAEVEARDTAGAAIGIPATPMVITSDISGPYASPLLTAAAAAAANSSASPRAGTTNPSADPRAEALMPAGALSAEGVPVVVSEQNNSGFYAVHWVPKPVQPAPPASPTASTPGGALRRLSSLLRSSPSSGNPNGGLVRIDGSLHGTADSAGSVGVSRRWVVTPEEGVALAVPRDLVTQGVPAATGTRATMWHRLSAGWPVRHRGDHPLDPPSAGTSTAADAAADGASSPGDIQITVLHEEGDDDAAAANDADVQQGDAAGGAPLDGQDGVNQHPALANGSTSNGTM